MGLDIRFADEPGGVHSRGPAPVRGWLLNNRLTGGTGRERQKAEHRG